MVVKLGLCVWLFVVICGSSASGLAFESHESIHAADPVDVRSLWAVLNVVRNEMRRFFFWLLYLRAMCRGSKYFLSSEGMVCGGGCERRSLSWAL